MEQSRFLSVDMMNTRTVKNKVFTKIVCDDDCLGWFPRASMLVAHPNVILDKWASTIGPEFSITLDNELNIGDGTRPSIVHAENIVDINMYDYLFISSKLRERGYIFNKKTRKIIKVDK